MRKLSDREQAVLVAMLQHAPAFVDETPISDADRQRWLRQVPTMRAGPRCGCGTCPSIELVDAAGETRGGQRSGLVLEAGADGAMLLLFIDEDRPSYLELAPIDEDVFTEFPAVEAMTFS